MVISFLRKGHYALKLSDAECRNSFHATGKRFPLPDSHMF